MENEKTGKKSSKTGYYLVSAAAFIVLGIVTIIFHNQITGMVDNVLKWIVAGVFAIIAIINIIQFAKNPGRTTIKDLIIGAFALVAMVILLVKSGMILWIVGILLGLYMLYEGVLKILESIRCKKGNVKNWYVLLILGIISVCAGLFLMWNTYKVASFLVLMVGILLLYIGIQNAIGLFLKS